MEKKAPEKGHTQNFLVSQAFFTWNSKKIGKHFWGGGGPPKFFLAPALALPKTATDLNLLCCNVIYKFSCSGCNATYYGKTSRNLLILIILFIIFMILLLQVILPQRSENENKDILHRKDSEEEDLPPWLAKEIEDADYIPIPNTKHEFSVKSVAKDEKPKGIRSFNTMSTYDDSDRNGKFENAGLILKIEELEKLNQGLMRKIEEQEETIKTLRKQNEIYAESNRKLLELSSNTD